jgi:predicted lipoprotein with Yx(FWY)xxD motif
MRHITSFAAVLTSVMAFGTSAGAQQAEGVPQATPADMMFKIVRIGQGVNVPGQSSVQPRERVIFADAADLPLYTFDKDEPKKSNCYNECADMWPPAVATEGVQPVGNWAVIDRTDGIRQWSFNDRPLYTYIKDAKTPGAGGEYAMYMGGGGPKGHDVDGVWHVFEIQPEEWLNLPQGITVEEVITAPGQVYTDERRMPLYVFSGDPNTDQALSGKWIPFIAYQLALPVGDFAVIARDDGIYQWALNGQALYTYEGDVEAGDSNGKGVHEQFELAWVMQYFTPNEVAIRKDQKRGGVLVEASSDKSLYARDRAFTDMQGGHHARGGTRGNPTVGRTIGNTGCDAECEKTWQPVIAPDDARASGYWSVRDRTDGRKQWAYQGYVMYTYANEIAGEVTGHDIYDLTVNDSTEELVASNLGLYWRVTSP